MNDSEQLFLAVQSGYVNAVQAFLDRDASLVNATRANDKETPLMMAAAGGDLNMLELLIQHGADVAAEDIYGKNALVYAIYANQSLCLSKLVDIVSTDTLNNSMHSGKHSGRERAIDCAVSENKSACLDILLRRPDIQLYNDNERYCDSMYIAIEKGYHYCLEVLLDHHGRTRADEQAEKERLVEYLCIAMIRGQEECTSMLLEHLDQLSVKGDQLNHVLLEIMYFDFPESAKLLLDRGADIYAKNTKGETLLDHAKSGEFIALLFEYKFQATEEAIRRNMIRIVRDGDKACCLKGLVQYYGANPHMTADQGFRPTLLMYAAEKGRVHLVKCLLELGADPSLLDTRGWNAFMYAAATARDSGKACAKLLKMHRTINSRA